MTRRTVLTWLVGCGLTACLCGVSARAADEASKVTGTWTWNFMRPNSDEKIEIKLKLKQEGEKLTGTITGRDGNDIEIKSGKVKGDEVEFDVVREFNGNMFTMHYTGKVEGDVIKGKSEVERDGEKRSRDWEAKRSKS